MTQQELNYLRQRLDDFMADDDPKLQDKAAIESDLNHDCVALGFDNWVDAWHRFSPRETELNRLLRIAFVPVKAELEETLR